MKKQLFIMALMASLGIPQASDAQTFTTPVAYSDVYPVTAPTIGLFRGTKSVSSYSDGTVNYPGGSAALYLAGWTGAVTGSGFSWRFADPADPSTIYNEGFFPYANIRDLEVGVVRSSGDPLIIAAYYEIGTGHKLDVYQVLSGVPSYSYTVTLSSSATYGRISMDCNDMKVAVCWQNSSTGAVEAMGLIPGSFGASTGPVVIIPDPAPFSQYISPDIAIGNSDWGTFINFVAHKVGGFSLPATDNLSEFSLTWSDLYSGSLSSFSVNDINPIIPPVNSELRPVIDAPDNYNVGNWAYTYGLDDSTINVRVMDFNINGGWPLTAVVNNGNLGNVQLTGKFNSLNPSLAYSPYGDGMYVAWYATEGQFNGYVSVKISENGTSLLSNPDYMLLPDAATPAPYQYAPGPGIALSKNNAAYTDFLYAAFYDADNLHHAYHVWGTPVFRPGTTGLHQPGLQKIKAEVLPNPFYDQVKVNIVAAKDSKVQLQLVDITGRIIKKSVYNMSQGNNELTLANLAGVPAGMYLVNILIDGQQTEQVKVVKK